MAKIFKMFGCMTAAAGLMSLAPAVAQDKGGISKWGAAPTFKGEGWEFKISGRAQVDYAIVDADTANEDWNSSELRRFRLGVKGKIGETVSYKTEFNSSSGGDIDIEDVYVQWKPGAIAFKLGQHKTPNSLDEQTSSRFISTLERSAFTDAFELDRRVGFSVNTKGDTYTFSAGVYGDNLNVESDEEGYALAARATFTPIKSKQSLVHLGGSIRLREKGDTQSDFRYRQRPVSHIPGRIISTGRVADSDIFFGVEGAAIVDRFWVAGEYAQTEADCTAAGCSDPSLDGAYLEAGYFLGGKKGYKEGKFNRPKVDTPVTDGGLGAVSFVARFDTIDLDETGTAGDRGGSYDAFILGADWWPTKYTRLGVNYFDLDSNLGNQDSGLDSAFATVNGVEVGEDVTGVIFRAQFDF